MQRPKGWIRVSPLGRQPDPPNLARLKAEITCRWPMTSLLDVLKETEWRVGFMRHFRETGTRLSLNDQTLQRRLLLCLFGLGTNTGLKRVCTTMPENQYHDLLYVRRRYLHPEALRNALAHVANAIFRIRTAPIGGTAPRRVPRTRSSLAPGTKISTFHRIMWWSVSVAH